MSSRPRVLCLPPYRHTPPPPPTHTHTTHPPTQVLLRRYPDTHPFANLAGTENIIQFTTLRYGNPPLIVRGPGAGPHVTAAGVFGDLITLARYLGAPS